MSAFVGRIASRSTVYLTAFANRFLSNADRTPAKIGRRSGFQFFIVCTLIFLAIETFVTLGPALHRSVPVEFDDSLEYLLRGAQMAECPRQDCPALEDLRSQFGATDPSIAAAQEAYWHVFLNHVPSYSIVVAALHRLGLDYFTVYDLLTVAGGALIVAGAAMWAYAMVGSWAGGIAILLFGTTYFVGHGLIWIVPSNMDAGFTMLALGIITQFRGRYPLVLLALLALILSWHSIGKFYGIALLCSYAVLAPRPYRRSDWAFLLIGCGLVVLEEAVTNLLGRPLLKMPLVPLRFEGTAWDAIRDNILEVPRVVGRTAFMSLGYSGLAAVALLAAIILPRSRRLPNLLFIGGFGCLCLISLLHLSPRIPAEIFARFWVPFSLVLACSFAYVLISATQAALKVAQEGLDSLRLARSQPSLEQHQFWRQVPVILIAFAMIIGTALHLAIGSYAIPRAEIMVSGRQDYIYTVGTTKVLKESDGSCGRIFYSREEVMFAHFLDGALDCRVYLNVTGAKDLRDPAFKDVRRVAFFNPVHERKGWVDLDRSWAVQAELQRPLTAPLRLLLRGTGEVQLLVVGGQGQFIQQRLRLADGKPTWHSLELAEWRPGYRLKLTTLSGSVQMGGLRATAESDDSTVLWPWGQGVRLHFQPVIPYQERPAADIDFDASLWSGVTGRTLRVMDDRGFGVVAAVE